MNCRAIRREKRFLRLFRKYLEFFVKNLLTGAKESAIIATVPLMELQKLFKQFKQFLSGQNEQNLENRIVYSNLEIQMNFKLEQKT